MTRYLSQSQENALEIEKLSALLDGELSLQECDQLLQKMTDTQIQKDLQDTWHCYAQIGDVLRSEELAMSFSQNSNDKLKARLAAEPTVIAPYRQSQTQKESKTLQAWKWLGWGVASSFVFVMATLLGVNLAKYQTDEQIRLVKQEMQRKIDMLDKAPQEENATARLTGNQSHIQSEDDFLVKFNGIDEIRDPVLDAYLQAHQKTLPSLSASPKTVPPAMVEK